MKYIFNQFRPNIVLFVEIMHILPFQTVTLRDPASFRMTSSSLPIEVPLPPHQQDSKRSHIPFLSRALTETWIWEFVWGVEWRVQGGATLMADEPRMTAEWKWKWTAEQPWGSPGRGSPSNDLVLSCVESWSDSRRPKATDTHEGGIDPHQDSRLTDGFRRSVRTGRCWAVKMDTLHLN